MSKNNQFLHAVHTFVDYDERLKSSTGKLLNSDCNDAVGILRKANVIQDSALSRLLDRGDVVSPDVLNVRGFLNPRTFGARNE